VLYSRGSENDVLRAEDLKKGLFEALTKLGAQKKVLAAPPEKHSQSLGVHMPLRLTMLFRIPMNSLVLLTLFSGWGQRRRNWVLYRW